MEAMGRAVALFQAGRLDESEALCLEIERRENGNHFYGWHLLSVIAAQRGQHARSAEMATRALALEPRNAEVLSNRGAALRNLDRPLDALADYDRAIAAAPAHAPAHTNRGVALAALNRFAEAREAYDRALALAPADARALFNRALARLVQGDLAGGFRDHEARWTGSDTQRGARELGAAQWAGEDIAGRTILLHAEQGLGDAIQFARYVPIVAARGASVLLEVHAALVPLLAGLEGAARTIERGAALPRFDVQCPLMSLPLAFGTTLESIPSAVPYLRAPPGHVDRWRARLGTAARPRVGLAWSGSLTLKNDRNRSIALERFARIRELDLDFVALQKDVREGDRTALGSGPPLATFAEALADFRDTAALVDLVDLVVTVDTSIAHLAGAMAKPVWLLLPFSPDWRWLLGRADSPWYPTMRLWRQPQPGDWDAVLGGVESGLRQLAP
jgi:tetratricopeptide (TPR) repeat protein